MVRCRSCEAALARTDRFCPACGTPNAETKFHPKFGPEPEGPPGPPPKHSAPPVGKPYCPRCWSVVQLADPWCSACGMSLDEVRAEAELAGYLGVWFSPDKDGHGRYRPSGKLGALVRVLLFIVGATAAVIAAASLVSVVRNEQLFDPVRFDGTTTSTWEGRLQLGMGAASILTAVVFVLWVLRAYRNLPRIGVRGLRFSNLWAGAVWLIPFVNLVLPKEVIDDLWRASDPDVAPLSSGWRLRTVPFWVHLWWISLLAAGLLIIVAQWVLPAPDAVETSSSQFGLVLAGLAHAAAALSAILGVLLVGEVGAMQASRVERLGFIRPFARLDASLVNEDEGAPAAEEPVERSLRQIEGEKVWGRY